MDLNNQADNSSNQSLKISPVISFSEFGLCCEFGAHVGLACFLGSAVPGSCMAWSVQTLLETLRHMVKGSLAHWPAEGHTHSSSGTEAAGFSWALHVPHPIPKSKASQPITDNHQGWRDQVFAPQG